MALWMGWSVLFNLDRSRWGTMSLGMVYTPSVIWGKVREMPLSGTWFGTWWVVLIEGLALRSFIGEL